MASRQQLTDAERTAQLVEDLGASVAAGYAAIELHMVGAVADELRAGRVGSLPVEQRLAREGARIAAGISTAAIAAAVVNIAAASGQAGAVDRAAGGGAGGAGGSGRPTPPPPPAGGKEVRLLIVQLDTDLAQMSQHISRWMPRAYRSASALLTLADHQEAVAGRFLAQGITGKVYRNGARMPIGSYAEMVARTISNQAAIVGAVTQTGAAGGRFVEVAIGSDACSSCAATLGKVYSIDGTPAGPVTVPNALGGPPVTFHCAGPLASASAGKGNHFRGPNCRCQVVERMPGTASATARTTWDPQREAERDRQRQLERNIRQWKARELAGLTPEEQQAAARQVRAWQAKMREHISATGRVRTPYREQLAFQTGAARAA